MKMKAITIFSLVMGMLITVEAYPDGNGIWIGEDIVSGQSPQMELSTAGKPLVAYLSGEKSLKFAREEGGSWVEYTISDNLGKGHFGFSVSPSDHIAAAFIEGTDYFDTHLMYSTFNGLEWSSETVPVVIHLRNYVNGLVFNTANEPGIIHSWYIYHDTSLPFSEVYIYFSEKEGSSWSTETIYTFSGDVGAMISLGSKVSTESGNPVLVMFNRFQHWSHTDTVTDVGYMAQNPDASWTYGSIISSHGVDIHSDLDNYSVFGCSSTNAGMALGIYMQTKYFYPGTNNLHYYNGASDEIVFSGGVNGASLASTSDGIPWIGYVPSGGVGVRVGTRESGSWSFQTIVESPDISSTVDIEIDGEQNPHLAYIDNGVIRHTYWLPSASFPKISSGDYNGDGTSDIAIFRESTGLWAVRGTTRLYFGSAGDLPVSGDYSADGTTDISIFRGSSGLWAVRGVTRAYFGTSSDTAVPFCFNPSSACDIAIFRPSSGLWAVKGVTRVYFGADGDRPVPGDYDGDRIGDIGIFRPSSGLWALKNISRIYFGSSDDTPVPGDYNGEGYWRPGIFRSSSGLWAIRGVTRVYYGSSEDTPVPANYAGSGSDSIGIFHPSTGLWAARGETRVYYGGSGDIPVTR